MKTLSTIRLVLGSGSPRRKQLMQECGFQFTVRTKEIDETPPPSLKRNQIAEKLALMKAEALKETLQENELIITADTIVCLGDAVLNKPDSKEQALTMLRMLNGKIHQVYTGVCLIYKGGQKLFSCETDVEFSECSENLLSDYVENYKPFDKAGSYGAQECLPPDYDPCSGSEKLFMHSISKPDLFDRTKVKSGKPNIPLIRKIQGSYFNVMGLPVVELSNELKKLSTLHDE